MKSRTHSACSFIVAFCCAVGTLSLSVLTPPALADAEILDNSDPHLHLAVERDYETRSSASFGSGWNLYGGSAGGGYKSESGMVAHYEVLHGRVPIGADRLIDYLESEDVAKSLVTPFRQAQVAYPFWRNTWGTVAIAAPLVILAGIGRIGSNAQWGVVALASVASLCGVWGWATTKYPTITDFDAVNTAIHDYNHKIDARDKAVGP